MKLSKKEREIVTDILLAEAPRLLEQLEDITVKSRNYTGVGLVMELSGEKPAATDGFTGYLGSDFYLRLPDLPGIFQVHLAVRNGRLDALEVSATTADAFPKSMESFQLCRFDATSSSE